MCKDAVLDDAALSNGRSARPCQTRRPAASISSAAALLCPASPSSSVAAHLRPDASDDATRNMPHAAAAATLTGSDTRSKHAHPLPRVVRCVRASNVLLFIPCCKGSSRHASGAATSAPKPRLLPICICLVDLPLPIGIRRMSWPAACRTAPSLRRRSWPAGQDASQSVAYIGKLSPLFGIASRTNPLVLLGVGRRTGLASMPFRCTAMEVFIASLKQYVEYAGPWSCGGSCSWHFPL